MDFLHIRVRHFKRHDIRITLKYDMLRKGQRNFFQTLISGNRDLVKTRAKTV